MCGELLSLCQLLYDCVVCLQKQQTPGLRSVHMKQVIPSLEILWTPPASAASLTMAQRKHQPEMDMLYLQGIKLCHMSVY